jgi:hypothetical protein
MASNASASATSLWPMAERHTLWGACLSMVPPLLSSVNTRSTRTIGRREQVHEHSARPSPTVAHASASWVNCYAYPEKKKRTQ